MAVSRSLPLSRFAWNYLSPQWGSLTVATFFSVCLGVVSATVGSMMGPAIQAISLEKDAVLVVENLIGPRVAGILAWFGVPASVTAGELLAVLPLSLIGVAAIRAGCGMGQWFLWERAGEVASRSVRQQIVDRFLTLDSHRRIEQKSKDQEGHISAILATDIRLMREYFVHFYGGGPREVFQALFQALMAFLISPKLFVIFLLGIVPAVAIVNRIGKKVRRRANAALENFSEMTEWLQQRLMGIETIKHLQTEAKESSAMTEISDQMEHRFLKAIDTKARTAPTTELIAVMSLTVVLLIAFVDISEDKLSGSVLMSFFATMAFMSQAAGKIARYYNSNREGAAAIDRLKKLFGYLNDCQSTQVDTSKSDNVTLDGVSFRYPESDISVLNNVSYTFEPGKIYCLMGPSGAGKSSLVRLVMGLLQPGAGKVVRCSGSIGYLPQKVVLTSGSLGENLVYPDQQINETAALEVLGKIQLKGFESELHTSMDDLNLSGGEAQRLLFGRLLYHKHHLVVIDEGTSALDPEIENLVSQRLRELANQGAIVITVAHRLAMAELADVVLLMENGTIADEGTLSELRDRRSL